MVPRRRQSRSTGFALLLVLLVLAVAVVAGTTYLASTSVKLASTNNMLSAGRADSLAESGLQHSLYLLRNEPGVLENSGATPVGPFTADAGADPYYCAAVEDAGTVGQYQVVGTGSSGGIDRRVSADVKVTSGYTDMVLAAGPESYWRLGEDLGLVAIDQMGHNSGIYRNNVALGERGAINGDPDTCAAFDGANDYVDLGGMDMDGTKVTLMAWARCDKMTANWERIVSKATGTTIDSTYWLLSTRKSSGTLRLQACFNTDDGTKLLIATTGEVPISEWFFAVATYDGGNIRLYLNGQLVGSTPHTGAMQKGPSVPAWIGGNPSGANGRPWQGLIDEVAIFKRTLSASEILNLYNARLPELKLLSWD